MTRRGSSPTQRSASARACIAATIVLVGCSTTTRELRGATTSGPGTVSTTSSDTVSSSATTSTPATTATPATPATPATSTDPTVPTSAVGTGATTTTSTIGTNDPGILALDLLSVVVVENEHDGGYDRDLFHYPKSMGGGCNTRTEVLRRDSITPAQIDPFGCTVVTGDWWSLYDRTHHTDPTELDIDHVVALKEAWDSGAWRWDDRVRTAFANDLTDPRTLRAITSAVNRDKSDKDPSNWLPPNPDDVCRYAGEWVAVKVRWGLSMDQSEFGRLRNLLTGPCAGTRVAPIDV